MLNINKHYEANFRVKVVTLVFAAKHRVEYLWSSKIPKASPKESPLPKIGHQGQIISLCLFMSFIKPTRIRFRSFIGLLSPTFLYTIACLDRTLRLRFGMMSSFYGLDATGFLPSSPHILRSRLCSFLSNCLFPCTKVSRMFSCTSQND